MKRYVMFLMLFMVFGFLLGSCNTYVKRPPVWPQVNINFIWYEPQNIYTIEEAMANIKNLQDIMYFEGLNPGDIYVDKYGMRVYLKWTESTYEKFANPTYSVNVFGIESLFPSSVTYQTYKETVIKEKSISIPFKDITGMFSDNYNGVYIFRANGMINYIKLSTPYDAQKLMDSIYTLAFYSFNRKIVPSVGIIWYDLTEKQKQDIGITNGVYILVEHNGPAYKSGLRNLDIIYEIDGKEIRNAEDMGAILRDMPESKYFEVKFIRWEEKEDRYILRKYKTKVKMVSR